jgi:hypothetical protein
MRTRVLLVLVSHQPLGERRLRRDALDARLARGCASTTAPDDPLRAAIALAEALDGPVTLAVTNERAVRLRRDFPSAFAALSQAYRDRHIRPMYVTAHHTDAALLAPAELADEIRLNQECVHQLLGAPSPLWRGLVLPGGAVESPTVERLETAGIDFVPCPPLDVARMRAAGLTPPERRPFRLGERLVGLAREEPLGEVQGDGPRVLQADLDALGAGGVDRLRTMLERPGIALVGADELLADVTPPWLPRVAAEHLEPAARATGVGAFLAPLLAWLVDAFGLERAPRVAAAALFAEEYRLDRLPPRVRLPLLLRATMRGDHGARPWLDGYALCDALHTELRLAGVAPQPRGELPSYALVGLLRRCEAALDPALEAAAAALGPAGVAERAAHVELARARAERRRADEELAAFGAAYAALQQNGTAAGAARWRELVVRLREHLGAVVIAQDHLRRLDALLAAARRVPSVPSPAEVVH